MDDSNETMPIGLASPVNTILSTGENEEEYQDDEISAEAFVNNLSIDQSDAFGIIKKDPTRRVPETFANRTHPVAKFFKKAKFWAFANPDHRDPKSFAAMPVERDSELYNMNHKRRGVALIFNHMNFDPRLGLKARSGTDADCANLIKVFEKMQFEVKAFKDLTYKDLIDEIDQVSFMNHSDCDCLVIAVLSHGELGQLYASDHGYKPESLWTPFTADRCSTLAGKPKLFFIQACQGDQLDSGMKLKKVNQSGTETDSSSLSYRIPTHADFLIAYSTMAGFYSWRNTTAGSWFVQALCLELNKSVHRLDLLSILTRVSRRVAVDFQSNTPADWVMHDKKQIPCIMSMLTRDVLFLPKKT